EDVRGQVDLAAGERDRLAELERDLPADRVGPLAQERRRLRQDGRALPGGQRRPRGLVEGAAGGGDGRVDVGGAAGGVAAGEADPGGALALARPALRRRAPVPVDE